MPNIGAPELLVILLVALVVFGPRKLPELGKSLGNGLREFRKSTQGLKDSMNIDAPTPAVTPAAQPVPVTAAAVSATPISAQAVTAVPVSSVTPQA
ncbi:MULTISPECIES: twin-arginine translocase TatA/TatE family subunit [unclassified Deinococcus]|uniref:twin-arginine translocase TatA/TatE family subunit n=1 Tax=unclassified Deinococcus TaxID=2623546 RepID=UPI000993A9A8|nr:MULTISPECIES: twin-arginine translocase TatA/TatE family subunit [unclassified Deinococcus]MCD0156388.1 twin-arginine translocase TatA/TatE family subunit [Deinococcus sp. 6GRE01]MCD0163299.1 twin-arginine translocase TatA/TatE family subunit [Deinococcus sp. 6YEL10]MCD0167056.1 twin-arginine translocase TatA/TatE family subunit [Deinococcus sp. 12RED42]MCD0168303.1 twin-arginine translocase TatA/TatE family subunit [Deinococcus sp. 23YEL01]MCD0176801.1 twin-arginine translocase TatA/TatE f